MMSHPSSIFQGEANRVSLWIRQNKTDAQADAENLMLRCFGKRLLVQP